MLFMHASKELLTLSPEILMSLEAFTFSEENTYVCLIDPINTHRQFADHNVRAAADMSLSGFSWAQTWDMNEVTIVFCVNRIPQRKASWDVEAPPALIQQ